MAETSVTPELQAAFDSVFGGQTTTAPAQSGGTDSAAPPAAAESNGHLETPAQPQSQSDEFPEFTPAQGDSPDIAALKQTLKGSMTKATQRMGEARREYESKAAELSKKAQALDLILGAEDPYKVLDSLRPQITGQKPPSVPQGAMDRLKPIAEKYEPDQFAAIMQIAREVAKDVWMEEARQNLTPYQRMLEGIANDRTQTEWGAIAKRFPTAEKYKAEAYEFAQQTGVPLQKALMAVSEGKVVEEALRATVTQQRQVESAPFSTPTRQAKNALPDEYDRDATAKAVAEKARSLGLHRKYQNI